VAVLVPVDGATSEKTHREEDWGDKGCDVHDSTHDSVHDVLPSIRRGHGRAQGVQTVCRTPTAALRHGNRLKNDPTPEATAMPLGETRPANGNGPTFLGSVTGDSRREYGELGRAETSQRPPWVRGPSGVDAKPPGWGVSDIGFKMRWKASFVRLGVPKDGRPRVY
jgi:hypothetical protein